MTFIGQFTQIRFNMETRCTDTCIFFPLLQTDRYNIHSQLEHCKYKVSSIPAFWELASFPIYRYITSTWNDQLPDVLIAQLVERCTGIAEVMGSDSVQAWIFFRLYFHNCLSCVHNCNDQSCLHNFLHSSNIWYFIYSLVFFTICVYYELTMWPAPRWLYSLVSRALHQYHSCHGFESCSGLNLFRA